MGTFRTAIRDKSPAVDAKRGRSRGGCLRNTASSRLTRERARFFAPADIPAGYQRIDMAGLAAHLASSPTPTRVVILYAHGCDGLSEISAVTGRFLARAGYLFIAPDSFARKEKPTS